MAKKLSDFLSGIYEMNEAKIVSADGKVTPLPHVTAFRLELAKPESVYEDRAINRIELATEISFELKPESVSIPVVIEPVGFALEGDEGGRILMLAEGEFSKNGQRFGPIWVYSEMTDRAIREQADREDLSVSGCISRLNRKLAHQYAKRKTSEAKNSGSDGQ